MRCTVATAPAAERALRLAVLLALFVAGPADAATAAPGAAATTPPTTSQRIPEIVFLGDTPATRPLVNDFRRFELGISDVFSRSVSLEARSIGLVTIVEDDRRWLDGIELSGRVALTRTLELGLTLPYEILNEGRPTLIPASATSASDLIEERSRTSGLGDQRVRLSRQWTHKGRGRWRRIHHVLDIAARLGTAGNRRDQASELALGDHATDLSIGWRGRFAQRGRSLDGSLSYTYRGEGRLVDDLGRTTLIDPGNEWSAAGSLRGDVRHWAAIWAGMDGFTSGLTRRDGSVLEGSRRWALRFDLGATARISGRTELDVQIRESLVQANVAESVLYRAGLRWRF